MSYKRLLSISLELGRPEILYKNYGFMSYIANYVSGISDSEKELDLLCSKMKGLKEKVINNKHIFLRVSLRDRNCSILNYLGKEGLLIEEDIKYIEEIDSPEFRYYKELSVEILRARGFKLIKYLEKEQFLNIIYHKDLLKECLKFWRLYPHEFFKCSEEIKKYLYDRYYIFCTTLSESLQDFSVLCESDIDFLKSDKDFEFKLKNNLKNLEDIQSENFKDSMWSNDVFINKSLELNPLNIIYLDIKRITKVEDKLLRKVLLGLDFYKISDSVFSDIIEFLELYRPELKKELEIKNVSFIDLTLNNRDKFFNMSSSLDKDQALEYLKTYPYQIINLCYKELTALEGFSRHEWLELLENCSFVEISILKNESDNVPTTLRELLREEF